MYDTTVTTIRIIVPVIRIAVGSTAIPTYPRKLSAKPIKYKLTLKDNPTNKARPSVPPIGKPRLREIIKYVPPVLTLLSVAIDETLNPVDMEIICATTIIATEVKNPACPTIQGNLRYIITPSIVKIEGVNTPLKVPNLPDFINIFENYIKQNIEKN